MLLIYEVMVKKVGNTKMDIHAWFHCKTYTVEPRLSEPRLSGTSIIRMRDLQHFNDIHRKRLPTRYCAVLLLSEYFCYPDELGTSGVRIIEAVLY